MSTSRRGPDGVPRALEHAQVSIGALVLDRHVDLTAMARLAHVCGFVTECTVGLLDTGMAEHGRIVPGGFRRTVRQGVMVDGRPV